MPIWALWGESWNSALSILVESIVSLLSFIQTPNLQAHPIPLATSPPAEVGHISEKPHTGLGVAAFVVLTAWKPNPMSGPRLAVGWLVFPVLGMKPMTLHKQSTIPD